MHCSHKDRRQSIQFITTVSFLHSSHFKPDCFGALKGLSKQSFVVFVNVGFFIAGENGFEDPVAGFKAEPSSGHEHLFGFVFAVAKTILLFGSGTVTVDISDSSHFSFGTIEALLPFSSPFSLTGVVVNEEGEELRCDERAIGTTEIF